MLSADVNGDAQPDAILISHALDASGLPMNISVALGRGDTWDAGAMLWFKSHASTSTLGPGLAAQHLLADMNDDLLQDVVVVLGGNIYVLFSNGSAFYPVLSEPYNLGIANTTGGSTRRLQQAPCEEASPANTPFSARLWRAASRNKLHGNRRTGAVQPALQECHEAAEGSPHTAMRRGTTALPMSARQRAASAHLAAMAKASAKEGRGQGPFVALGEGLLDMSAGPGPQPDAHSETRRALQQTPTGGGSHLPTNVAALPRGAFGTLQQVRVLATLSRELATSCTWHTGGVRLMSNVPGEQLLLACPSGGTRALS